MNGRDLEYFQRRERQERAHADRADGSVARRLHLEMAERYSSKLREIAGLEAYSDLSSVSP